MKNNRILIISGGSISIDFVREYLNNQEFRTIIAVDSGLKIVDILNLEIQYIVGDFDSVPPDLLERYRSKMMDSPSFSIKEYNPVKDVTDTHIAIELAIKLEAEEIVILGATGTRIDHMLANIHLLYLPLMKNKKAIILDEHNKIYLLNKNTSIFQNQLFGQFVSLLPLTEVVTGVTLRGFKYPLEKRTVHVGDSLGVSNEIVSSRADILLESGILVVIEAKD